MDVTSIIVAQKAARIKEKKLHKLQEDAAKKEQRLNQALEQGVGEEHLPPYKAAIRKVAREIKAVSDGLAVDRATIFAMLAPEAGILVEAPVFKPEMYIKSPPRADEDGDAGDRIPAIHSSPTRGQISAAYVPVPAFCAPVAAAVEVISMEASQHVSPDSESPVIMPVAILITPPTAVVEVVPQDIAEDRNIFSETPLHVLVPVVSAPVGAAVEVALFSGAEQPSVPRDFRSLPVAVTQVALPDAGEHQVPPSDAPAVVAVQVEPDPTAELHTRRRRRTLRQMADDAIVYAGGIAAMFAFESMRQIGALVDGDDALLTDVQRVFCCLLCI